MLAQLDRIQLERAAGLVALEEEKQLGVRLLRRRRSRALEDLEREEKTALARFSRRMSELTGLEEQLSGQLNKTVISRLMDDVDPMTLATPAIPRSYSAYCSVQKSGMCRNSSVLASAYSMTVFLSKP